MIFFIEYIDNNDSIYFIYLLLFIIIIPVVRKLHFLNSGLVRTGLTGDWRSGEISITVLLLVLRRMATQTISKTVKSLSSMPGPTSLPLVGSALLYRFGERSKTEYHLALLDMYRQFGPIVRENIGGTTIVHVFHLEDIKSVYNIEGKWPIIPPLQVLILDYRV